MFESPSQISIPDNKSQKITPSNNQQLSLPLISQKPSSRGNVNKQNVSRNNKMTLPTIGVDLSDVEKRESALLSKKNENSKDYKNLSPKKATFALQVEEKLKMVLGGIQHKQQVKEGDDSFDSEDFDFEAKVNANKQLIKLHRMKKQNKNNSIESVSKNKGENKPKKYYSKNQNLYEKRVKQYREQVSQNKYLQKKKQTIVNKGHSPVQQILRQIKSKDYISMKKDLKYSESPKKMHPRAMSQKNSKKNLNQVNKSMNLFDSIQNYLENPSQSLEKDKKNKPLIGLSLLKAKRDLQDKIKAINQKLKSKQQNFVQGGSQTLISIGQSEGNMNDENIFQKTVKQWRKFEIKQKKLSFIESNFDKQMERINLLQEKTTESLQKYLDHQKILLELEQKRKQQRHSTTQ